MNSAADEPRPFATAERVREARVESEWAKRMAEQEWRVARETRRRVRRMDCRSEEDVGVVREENRVAKRVEESVVADRDGRRACRPDERSGSRLKTSCKGIEGMDSWVLKRDAMLVYHDVDELPGSSMCATTRS